MNLAEGDIKYNFQIPNATANNDKKNSASIKKVVYFNQPRHSQNNQESSKKSKDIPID